MNIPAPSVPGRELRMVKNYYLAQEATLKNPLNYLIMWSFFGALITGSIALVALLMNIRMNRRAHERQAQQIAYDRDMKKVEKIERNLSEWLECFDLQSTSSVADNLLCRSIDSGDYFFNRSRIFHNRMRIYRNNMRINFPDRYRTMFARATNIIVQKYSLQHVIMAKYEYSHREDLNLFYDNAIRSVLFNSAYDPLKDCECFQKLREMADIDPKDAGIVKKWAMAILIYNKALVKDGSKDLFDFQVAANELIEELTEYVRQKYPYVC